MSQNERDWDNLSKEQQEAVEETLVHLKPLIVEEALMLQRAFPDLNVAWDFSWDISLKKDT